MYRFRKWYVDCLTPQNDFLLAYLGEVQFAGFCLRSLTVHLVRPGSVAGLTKTFSIPRAYPPRSAGSASPVAGVPVFQTNSGKATLQFTSADSALDLHWQTLEPPGFEPVLIRTGRASFVLWKPLACPCAVSGRVNLAGQQLELHDAAGYADYLESTCLPRRVPIRNLRWGRVSEPDLGVTYMFATDRFGAHCCSRIYAHTQNSLCQSDAVELHLGEPGTTSARPSPAESAYSIFAHSDMLEAALRVQPDSCLQQGCFVDQQSAPSAPVRALLKWFTRNPRGCKRLGRADLSVNLRGSRLEQKQTPFIDELVDL